MTFREKFLIDHRAVSSSCSPLWERWFADGAERARSGKARRARAAGKYMLPRIYWKRVRREGQFEPISEGKCAW